MEERLDRSEKENFKSLLLEIGADRIEDRLNIIDVFLNTEGHISIDELCEILKKKGYFYDKEFVQECMEDIVKLGFAQKKQFEGRPVLYEHRHLGRHHDHLICTKCGRIIEFKDDELETLQRKIANRYGFYMLQHKMEIYGLCSSCFTKREPLIPLSLAKEGEELIVKDIVGGKGIREKLVSMGIRIGSRVEVISNPGAGRVIIACGDSRIALGRGIANKILVSIT